MQDHDEIRKIKGPRSAQDPITKVEALFYILFSLAAVINGLFRILLSQEMPMRMGVNSSVTSPSLGVMNICFGIFLILFFGIVLCLFIKDFIQGKDNFRKFTTFKEEKDTVTSLAICFIMTAYLLVIDYLALINLLNH